MLPLWPSINPSLVGSLMNNVNPSAFSEEMEMNHMEQEQQNYLNLVDTIAQDLTPLGKKQSEQNNEDSDAESASDDQESSASEPEDHESEDDNDGRESFTINY
ncbi:CLUMA_CG021423, isoform A [Clunio marinus]|uniref:CLUMA_CG021423, isoform A n=1 Tax=Clunio marinus TaxID=568069 RepID=A0A1J1J988_9DIPT|nr:CLUMA_CG021423, isoform A [Clunio marinus]